VTLPACEMPLGARVVGDQLAEFRVWAPQPRSVALSLGGELLPMEETDGGVHEVRAPARAGDDYQFVLDGQALPDPCSRWQPEGLRGPSRVLATSPPAPPERGLELAELVIYELHVGTFSAAGTFESAIPHLAQLAELGIGAIEIMPVAEFPGRWGWGYDGVYISAAQSSYGGPEGLRALVEAAHRVGLGVILDVVYNHVGASGVTALEAFGPYFTAAQETPWGQALDYTCPAVREWACQSAEQWIADFGIDGLRLDAIHAIIDPSPEPIVAEVARRVHGLPSDALVIGEVGLSDPSASGAPACDAIWDDHFHHALHTLLTGEHEGYYEAFGRVQDMADAVALTPARRRIVYAQNHDQVGNRAFGDRLPEEVRPLAAFSTLLSPFVPLLFMGEEYGETAPFQFFSDHIDPEIAQATREGRRNEFAAFSSFSAEEIPDPQDPATFQRSKLSREPEPALAELYRELLRVRRELPAGDPEEVTFDEKSRWLRIRRGTFELVVNFATQQICLPVDDVALRLVTSEDTRLDDRTLRVAALSGVLLQDVRVPSPSRA
jgi:maltooligosyltrehalose trehalohydrolase